MKLRVEGRPTEQVSLSGDGPRLDRRFVLHVDVPILGNLSHLFRRLGQGMHGLHLVATEVPNDGNARGAISRW